jgi:replicative DNA helicase
MLNRIAVADAPNAEHIDLGVLAKMRAEKLRPLSVVHTPWPTWNALCRGAGGGEGLAHGWHVVVGASSGAGKSLAATNIAATAVRNGEHVCLLSLEMSQDEVVTRLLAIFANEEVRKLEHGRQFCSDSWNRASDVLAEAKGSIRVNPEPIGTLAEIRIAIQHAVEEGCRTIIVDYLQLAWVHNAETMISQITEVSHTIRGLAREHRVLTIGLSQVNRATSGTGGELRKEGLLGGSSLENDADQVLLLGKPKPDGTGYRSEVKLDKNRHGPPGEWGMILDTRSLRMREAYPDEEASRAR